MTHEPALRLSIFLAVLALMALAEAASPRRRRELPRLLRWSNNLALVAVDALLLRLLLPVTATGLALLAEARGWGLFNLLALPGWLAAIAAMALLDLAIYAQHVAFHAVPPLWRLHRVHHADTEIDVTTGLRFHPGEILLSMAWKLALVLALGPPPAAVLAFEVLLNATAIFNHANLRLPGDAALRWLLVTPDMHRVHHSALPAETDSNFGFNLPWWDRLFGTYRAQPAAGHEGMTIGLAQFRGRREQWVDRMLVQPCRKAQASFEENTAAPTAPRPPAAPRAARHPPPPRAP